MRWFSENAAQPPPLFLRLEGRSRGRLENLPNPFVQFCRALEVSKGADLLRHCPSVFRLDGFLLRLGELPTHLVVVAKIFLVPDQDDGDSGAEMPDFWRPLFGDVLERVGTVDGEAHEDHVCVRVGERTQTIVVFLAWGGGGGGGGGGERVGEWQ